MGQDFDAQSHGLTRDSWCKTIQWPMVGMGTSAFCGLLVYRYTVYIRIPTPSISKYDQVTQDVPGHLAGECQVWLSWSPSSMESRQQGPSSQEVPKVVVTFCGFGNISLAHHISLRIIRVFFTAKSYLCNFMYTDLDLEMCFDRLLGLPQRTCRSLNNSPKRLLCDGSASFQLAAWG